MKLFYSPGACSLSPHIVLLEIGAKFTLDKVDMKTKKTKSGEDFTKISAKGYIPHLILDNGEHLSEGVAMVQYLADLKPEANLIPKQGSFERVRLQEWLNFISTELHKGFSPLFRPELASTAEFHLGKLKKNFEFVSDSLKGKQYLMGNQFTVADAYLFTVLGWHKFIKLDLSPWPVLVEYYQRIGQRPKVKEAMAAEGLA